METIQSNGWHQTITRTHFCISFSNKILITNKFVKITFKFLYQHRNSPAIERKTAQNIKGSFFPKPHPLTWYYPFCHYCHHVWNFLIIRTLQRYEFFFIIQPKKSLVNFQSQTYLILNIDEQLKYSNEGNFQAVCCCSYFFSYQKCEH